MPETGFCIHALNAVYISSLNRWIRLDARGNKAGVDARFDLEQERLAFSVRRDFGEVDYGIVYANPSDKLMKVLEESTDALYMYLNCLPDSIFEYRRATIEDIDELVRTRIIVLRAANKLSDNWELGNRRVPQYLLRLMAYKVEMERLSDKRNKDDKGDESTNR